MLALVSSWILHARSDAIRTPHHRILPLGSSVHLDEGTTALSGTTLPLIPRDSAVAILITAAECNRGRMGIAAFRKLEQELRDTGIAFRVVVKSRRTPSRQYARLFLQPETVVEDLTGEILGPLNTTVVPSLVVLDRAGVVVARRAPVSTRTEDVRAIVREAASTTDGSSRGSEPRSIAANLN